MTAHTREFPCAPIPTRDPRPLMPVSGAGLGVLLLAGLLLVAARDGYHTVSVRRERATIHAPMAAGVVTSFDRRESHDGRYTAEVIATSTVAVGAAQSWVVHVTGRTGRRIAHAELSAEAWMPETGERSSVRPRARYVGNGDYQLDSLLFTRSGWWNVALVIDGRMGRDSVAFNVKLAAPEQPPRPTYLPTT